MAYTTTDVEQLLVKESGRIGPDIYRKTVDQSPWLKLVKQDTWPDEMGDSVSVMVYERSLPYNSDGTIKTNWTALSSSAAYGTAGNGTGNAIAPDGGTIEFGQTLRTYNLSHTSLNSPDISLNDLRFPLKRKEQLANIMSILTESTSEVWIQRYRDEYSRVALNKITATTNGAANVTDTSLGVARYVGSGTTFPAPSATASENLELTQGILDRIYLMLVRDGAGINSYDRVNGAPVFLAIMSPEASDALIRSNADIRQDFRWSDKVNELLAPLGVQRTYRNYHHMVDPFPPRYDYVSSAWVRRRPFKAATNDLGDTSRGVKYELNSDYLAAAYEDTIIFVPEVFTSLVPKPLSVGSDMEFSPQDYRGEFTWRNIPSRDANPDGTIGFFRAIFASGSKPVFPQQGYVIRHKRSASSIV
jgi:hypothetical protein